MIAKEEYRCSECGKEFVTKGNSFNQIILRHYSYYKLILHYIAKHRETTTLKFWIIMILKTLEWIPLLIAQAVQIIIIPVLVILEVLLIWFFITHI